jgi:DNA-binding LacI/PurR family transcriptional regulator
MATRADVARLAGVSESTVSYALNGQRSLKPETKKRVLAAVKQLNYTPHFAAGVLAGGRANSIALIFPSYGGSFSSLHLDYVEGVIDGAKARNYHVVVWPGEDTPSAEISRFYKTGLVSGVILMEILDEDERVNALHDSGIPFVMIGRTAMPEKFKYVDRDFDEVAMKSLKHLVDLGHTKVSILTHRRVVAGHVVSVDERFTSAMERAERKLGLDINLIMAENSIEGGFAAFAKFQKQEMGATAVVGLADLVTVGFSAAAQREGISIPDEISLLGLNNPPHQIGLVQPNLTVVSLPALEMGRAAANILIDEILGESNHPIQQLWGGEIEPGRSTAIASRQTVRGISNE